MRGLTQDTIIIDCCTGGLAASAAFWSNALDMPISADAEEGYASLQTNADEPAIMLHQVEHVGDARLDMVTHDLDAEATRLQTLGARRMAFSRDRWWAMEAPGGQPFRLVQVTNASATRSRGFDLHAGAPWLRRRACGAVQ